MSWWDLEEMNDPGLNYLYVDTLAKENVLQQKIEPNRDYYISDDYKYIYIEPSITLQKFLNPDDWLLWEEKHYDYICLDELCKITGINYYGLVECYKKNICII